ncbi:hypothetical protein ACOSQ4_024612 [Xanthoceras sorbifolium]
MEPGATSSEMSTLGPSVSFLRLPGHEDTPSCVTTNNVSADSSRDIAENIIKAASGEVVGNDFDVDMHEANDFEADGVEVAANDFDLDMHKADGAAIDVNDVQGRV